MSNQECRYCGCNSKDQYRAELYDEVWQKARDMGYGNVTDALVALERMKATQPAAGEPVAWIGPLGIKYLAEFESRRDNRTICVYASQNAEDAVPLYMAPPAAAHEDDFQARVQPWMLECFGEMIAGDREERNHRFLEEALELVQSTGCTASEAHQLVDYVFGRPVGEPAQEVGGVMVTLAALCLANSLDMHDAAEVELARIWTKVEVIRAKQAAKPKHSPLPEAAAHGDDGRTCRFCKKRFESAGECGNHVDQFHLGEAEPAARGDEAVLPERRPSTNGTWGDMGDAYSAGWNDCLDRVAEMRAQAGEGEDHA